MNQVHGTYFDGEKSRAYDAVLRSSGGVLFITCEEGLKLSFPLSECRVDPPLGRTMRTVRLPGRAVFETMESDALDTLERSTGRNRTMRFVYEIERRWKTVIASFTGIMLFVWIFHTYAIPHLAEKVSYSVPVHFSESISREAMKALDSHLFSPSALPGETADAIRHSFDDLLRDLGPDGFIYKLEFRKSPVIGPNAFALPSGLIIMTDELVNLSENEHELDSILLHEIAHVKGRHSLRTAIQNAGVFLIIAALTGDITEISSTAASLPTILAHSGYSRAFEREADRFAALYFIKRNWSVKPFQDILLRISKDMPRYPGESLISSHPVIEDRIRHLESLASKQEP